MDELSRVDVAVALLRVIAGLTVAAHGYAKLFRGGRLNGTAAWFDGMGMRPGWLHARLAAGTEVAAGLLFALGLFTSFAAAAIVALMFVAGWTVHRGNGFFIVGEGWEYNLVLATIAVVVSTAGAGELSLDGATPIGGWAVLAGGWAGFAVSALGGLLAAVAHLAVFYRPPVLEPAASSAG